MLPFLRIIPVGGVLLAIMIVVLAHEPPGASHAARTHAEIPVRGALLRLNDHPEWRQFLILAAVRRADELSRLRELPDSPVQNDGKIDDKIASLPTGGSDREVETGTIKGMPKLTLPLEIGETSSTKLTAITPEKKPPSLKPSENKAPSASRRKTPPRARQAKTPAQTQPAVANSPVPAIRAEQY
ncbi:MAG: hypothetical protein HY244_17025 [Rhizobiales bacterium]|nr:hypothetical protein [Hyphomicrobiales bacterium]